MRRGDPLANDGGSPVMSTARQRLPRLGVDLALLLVLAAMAALLISGGYTLELGGWQISSHRLDPLLRLLLILAILRLWLAVGWKNLLLVGISTGLALLAGEFMVRLLNPPLAQPNMVQIHRPSAQLDWELVPEASGVGVLGETIRINQAGFRDRPHPLEKPEGAWRIAVMGDSFTFAMGVDLEQSFHQVLAANLAESYPSTEILAFGVAGYQLWQHLALLRHRVLDYQPDVVVLALFLDDIERPRSPVGQAGWAPHNPFVELLPPLENPSRLWTLLGNINRLLEVRYRYQRGADHLKGIEARRTAVDEFYQQVQFGKLPPQNYQDFADTLASFVSEVRSSGARCLLAYIPDASQLHQPRRQDINARIDALARELEVGFVDFTPSFESVEDPAALYLFPLDAHTSATGHRLMAQTLEAALEAGNLLSPTAP